MESLDKIVMGTAVTNLTRMDLLREYGDLERDRLIMNPGGAIPLSNVNLVLGAVTCSGKLSLVVEYEEGTADTETMIQIKDKAFKFLLNAHAKDPVVRYLNARMLSGLTSVFKPTSMHTRAPRVKKKLES